MDDSFGSVRLISRTGTGGEELLFRGGGDATTTANWAPLVPAAYKPSSWNCTTTKHVSSGSSVPRAGQFTHIAQQFNSEVNPHGGVPLTEVWRTQVVASLENLGCLRGD